MICDGCRFIGAARSSERSLAAASVAVGGMLNDLAEVDSTFPASG